MRVEFGAFIRRRSKSNTYYVVIPADYVKSIEYNMGRMPLDRQAWFEMTIEPGKVVEL